MSSCGDGLMSRTAPDSWLIHNYLLRWHSNPCLQVTRACDWPANVPGCGAVAAKATVAGRRMQGA